MKIFEWNMHGAASFPSYSNYSIPQWAVDEILIGEPDCIVLTEFVISKGWDYLQEKLKDKYHWFISATTGKNGLLIALRKNDFYDFSSIFKFQDYTINNNEVLRGRVLPDFYEIRVKIRNEEISIIGVRMRKDILKSDPHYTISQFIALDDYLASLKHKVICIGDFNAHWKMGRIWKTNDNRTLPKSSKTYNLHTPDYNAADGFSYVQPDGTKVQLDHLIIKNNINLQEIKYDWTFVSNHASDYGDNINKDSPKKPKGLPDHAILKAEVII